MSAQNDVKYSWTFFGVIVWIQLKTTLSSCASWSVRSHAYIYGMFLNQMLEGLDLCYTIVVSGKWQLIWERSHILFGKHPWYREDGFMLIDSLWNNSNTLKLKVSESFFPPFRYINFMALAHCIFTNLSPIRNDIGNQCELLQSTDCSAEWMAVLWIFLLYGFMVSSILYRYRNRSKKFN